MPLSSVSSHRSSAKCVASLREQTATPLSTLFMDRWLIISDGWMSSYSLHSCLRANCCARLCSYGHVRWPVRQQVLTRLSESRSVSRIMLYAVGEFKLTNPLVNGVFATY